MSVPRLALAPGDRAAAMDVQHAAFGRDEPRLAFHARRLASPRREPARTWILEDEGRVVSTLLAFPLSFGTPDGSTVPGFGFGGVATLPDARKRGHASRLCAFVVQHCLQEERPLGLLFSAIPPALYERLGFEVVPAWDHVTDRLADLVASGPAAEWTPLDPFRTGEHLAAAYDAAHRGTLHLARDPIAWTRAWMSSPSHVWLGLGDPSAPRGYARLEWYRDVLDVHELILPAAGGESEAEALRGLAAFALELGLVRMEHWLPRSKFVAEWFEDEGREKALPMVRDGRGEGAALPSGAKTILWSSDYF